ncbi:allantoate amidohydrolase [soil metagenome]
MRSAGLATSRDAAGNLFGRWETGTGPTILVGSHLDTVPSGGRFDGALGVVGALDAVRRLQASGFRPARPITVVAFMDEEGARFGTDFFGSRAFVGDDLVAEASRTDLSGVSLAGAMGELGRPFDELRSAVRVEDVAAYLELHIEQGPVLEQAEAEIGIVTAIVGFRSLRVVFDGTASHIGTTPMDARSDALAGAARAVLALREHARRSNAGLATTGSLIVEPGVHTVIPGRTTLVVDMRAADDDVLDSLAALFKATVEDIASEEGLDVELVETLRGRPVPLDSGIAAIATDAASLVGAQSLTMTSGAIHDAMVLAQHVPTGLLFVPSVGGVSHSPDEHTTPAACEVGVATLAETLKALAT